MPNVSFSGGKDSTAMLIRLVEENYPIDEVVYFDTGWEFPEMVDHVQRVSDYIGREITVLRPPDKLEYLMCEKPITAKTGEWVGQTYRYGYGWPTWNQLWCHQIKMHALDRQGKGKKKYIGIGYGEKHRADGYSNLFPLIDWKMTGADCLQYCYDRGFDFGGLYNYFPRVSCFCCPLQRVGTLQVLWKHFPHLWKKMEEWDTQIEKGLVHPSLPEEPRDWGFKSKTIAYYTRKFTDAESEKNK